MTLKEAKSLSQFYWIMSNRSPRKFTTEEADRIRPNIINAIVYAAVLNGVMYDFIDALKNERFYNDRVKTRLRLLHQIVAKAHSDIYREFSNAIDGFGRLYNERYDRASNAIEKNCFLEGAEKYYNIVLALLRLIKKNHDACGAHKSPAIMKMHPYIDSVMALNLPFSDKGNAIEAIITSASNEVMHKNFEKFLKDFDERSE